MGPVSATGLHPASAAAIAKCILARTRATRGATKKDLWSAVAASIGISNAHPRACGWCDYQVRDLESMLNDFDLRGEDAAWFRALPHEKQHSMVLEAQAFPEVAA